MDHESRQVAGADRRRRSTRGRPESSERTPQPTWLVLGQALILGAFLAAIAQSLLREPPHLVVAAVLMIGVVSLVTALVQQVSLRRSRRG